MTPIEAILIAITPGLARLIESALADTHDPETELQAILEMQRALADRRVQASLDAAQQE